MKPKNDDANAASAGDGPDCLIPISPKADRRVRHPGGELLETGTGVTWSPYWQRRLDDGDIVHSQAQQKED